MARVHRPKIPGSPKCGVAPLRSGAVPAATRGVALRGRAVPAAGTHDCPRGSATEAGGSGAHHLTVAEEIHGCPRGSGTEAGGGRAHHLTVAGVPMEQVQADPLAADGTRLLIDAQAMSQIQAGHLAVHGVCLSGFECAGDSKLREDAGLLECQTSHSHKYLTGNIDFIHPVPSMRFQGTIGSNDANCRVLLDCGAEHDVISVALCKRLKLKTYAQLPDGSPVHIKFGNGQTTQAMRVADPLPLKLNGHHSSIRFLVAPLDLNADIVLGMTWLHACNPLIDWYLRTLTFSGLQGQSILVEGEDDITPQMRAMGVVSPMEMARIALDGEPCYLATLKQIAPVHGTSGEAVGRSVTNVTDLPAVIPGDVACVACWSNESNQDDPQAPPMLLCEACSRGFHTLCLVPPLVTVPPEDERWFCPQCRKPGDSTRRRQ
jgi:hypothetical protein